MTATKNIERANDGCEHFARLYEVEPSKVVWCGNEKYIVLKGNCEIRIGFN